MSITKLWAQSGSPTRPPPGITRKQTPDYLYRRAIEFAPRDGTVRLFYGILYDVSTYGTELVLV
jgi:hypothetical protein